MVRLQNSNSPNNQRETRVISHLNFPDKSGKTPSKAKEQPLKIKSSPNLTKKPFLNNSAIRFVLQKLVLVFCGPRLHVGYTAQHPSSTPNSQQSRSNILSQQPQQRDSIGGAQASAPQLHRQPKRRQATLTFRAT